MTVPRSVPLSRFMPQGLDPQRELPFTCLGSRCPKSCCGPFAGRGSLRAALSHDDLGGIIGDDPDVDRDSVNVFAHIRLTEKDVERLQRAGHDDLMVRRGEPGDLHYYMRLRSDGGCAALAGDGFCSIHPSRPTLCRAFPFYIDMFAGLTMVEDCSGLNQGSQTIEQLHDEITAAVEMYEFWIEQLKPAKAQP